MKFLELGPEKNRNTRRARFSDAWTTMGLSKKTPADFCCDVDLPFPFEDDTFGVVFASHVLEHAHNPVATLKECRRVLVPGGWCRMNVPDARWLISRYLDGKCGIDHMVEQLRSYEPGLHRWGFDEVKLLDVFSQAGFSECSILPPGKTSIEECQDPYFWNRSNRTIYCEGRNS